MHSTTSTRGHGIAVSFDQTKPGLAGVDKTQPTHMTNKARSNLRAY
jgi:hypothetical protein